MNLLRQVVIQAHEKGWLPDAFYRFLRKVYQRTVKKHIGRGQIRYDLKLVADTIEAARRSEEESNFRLENASEQISKLWADIHRINLTIEDINNNFSTKEHDEDWHEHDEDWHNVKLMVATARSSMSRVNVIQSSVIL